MNVEGAGDREWRAGTTIPTAASQLCGWEKGPQSGHSCGHSRDPTFMMVVTELKKTEIPQTALEIPKENALYELMES
ncbi:protein jagged-2, partial [Biomphalaria glabrata]